MSEYNSYARELDKAFKKAREEYAELVRRYDTAKSRLDSANTQFKENYTGERAIKQARAKAEFAEAENALRYEGNKIWDSFMLCRKQLGDELAQAVNIGNIANPAAIDNNALELLKSGILNADDMEALAAKYDNNPTMLRLVGKYAEELANEIKASGVHGASETRGRLYNLAVNCKDGRNKIMRAWDDLVSATNYCSGIGGGSRRREARFAVRMAERWDELTANKIANF